MRIWLLIPCLIVLACVNARAQYSVGSNNPDCYFTEVMTAAGRTVSFDNRELGCSVWVVQVVNLSNASAAYTLDASLDGSTWRNTSNTTNGVATVTAGTIVNNFDTSYVSLNLTSKGTGNFIVAISGYAYKKAKNSSNSAVAASVPMTILNDVASATITYNGSCKAIFAPATNTSYAICAIQKITVDGSSNLVSVLWADGNSNEDNIWANRASLSYQ